MKILMYCLLALNVGVWLMYGIDKWKAKSGRWRIPEKVLLLAAFAGGSVGALAGMMMFRHKTKKAKFVISVPIFFVIHCVIAGYYGYGQRCNSLSHAIRKTALRAYCG